MRDIRMILFLVLTTLVSMIGCGKADPPCPRGVLNVTQQEADEGLRRRAQKEIDAGKGNDVAVTFNCGYDEASPGMYREVSPINLSFGEVMVCVVIAAAHPPRTLTDCMQAVARTKMASKQFWKEPSVDLLHEATKKTRCSEVDRAASVEADKHSLNRDGANKWIEVLLGAAVIADRMIGAAMAPATAGFVIHVGDGQDQTCYDTPRGPSAGCLDTDGCGGAPPGATVPGGTAGSGDVIQPGTDPGTPGGDHL